MSNISYSWLLLLLVFNADMNHSLFYLYIKLYIRRSARSREDVIYYFCIPEVDFWYKNVTQNHILFIIILLNKRIYKIMHERNSLTLQMHIACRYITTQNIWYYSVWQQNIASHSSFYNWIARNNLYICAMPFTQTSVYFIIGISNSYIHTLFIAYKWKQKEEAYWLRYTQNAAV